MKITAQEEYGLRCVLQLAKHHGRDPLLSRTIAKGEGLSSDYVRKLLMSLRRSGLVKSVRGIKGGFVLNGHPDTITISQVLQALSEGTHIITSPADQLCEQFSGQRDVCIHFDACGIRPVWTAVARSIARLLDQITLAVLLQDEVQVFAICEHTMLPQGINRPGRLMNASL